MKIKMITTKGMMSQCIAWHDDNRNGISMELQFSFI